MDAVTFMDAMKRPRQASAAPPQRPKRRVSPNMALFATIGVLLLAMGVGVLIGRSGNHTVASAPVAPQVIKVGGGEESATSAGGGASGVGGGAKQQKPKAEKKVEAKAQESTEEVLKTEPGVKLAPPKAQVGEPCEKDTAGCGSSGKFDGSFFE